MIDNLHAETRRLVTALLSVLCAAALAASRPALAGPNGGGTLIVHDTGLGYTSTSSLYSSTPPMDCASTDNEMPVQIDPGSEGRVWKVYVAFVPGTHPRLKALAFGEAFDDAQVAVLSAGLPDPVEDFEISQDGWPSANGGSDGITFGAAKTALINEVYWFAGYARDGASGLWSTVPHRVQASIFVDDSSPRQTDAIAGFSSIGFGRPGMTVCPALDSACCLPDGACQVLTPQACGMAGGVFAASLGCSPNPCSEARACCFNNGMGCWVLDPISCAGMGGFNLPYGTACSPDPCPSRFGACCLVTGSCVISEAEPCAQAGGWYLGHGTSCWEEPCAGLTVACCIPDGHCLILNWQQCEQSGWSGVPGVTSCSPNPCPQPTGSCCYPDGSCMETPQADCGTGAWYVWRECNPNPCPQIGACCRRDGTCGLSLRADCADAWIAGGCDPNPCPALQGACCLADGSCAIRLMVECELEFVPGVACNPASISCPNLVGGCCFMDGSCRLLPRGECEAAGGYIQGNSCGSYYCSAPIPVERTSWGRIKAAYR